MMDRADFNYRRLGRLLRSALQLDGRGWRACADEIGVTPSDLSRISAGQATAAHKVIAVCDWLKIDLRDFYSAPMFHGSSTETGIDEPRGAAI